MERAGELLAQRLGALALGRVVGAGVVDLVFEVTGGALVLALDLVGEIAEGVGGLALEAVAGGVERIAGVGGADGGGEVDDEVGLQTSAER